jgi:hypothetical protein
MLTFAALLFLYFLPTILAHNKPSFVPIFLLNFFLGWTVVGWIGALMWALVEPSPQPRVIVQAAPAPGRYCCGCGAPAPSAWCSNCGRRLA